MKAPRVIVALLLCCALALARMLGVHVHVAHQHATVAEVLDADHAHGHDRDHGAARIVSELADHADSHLSHAEIDADTADKTAGKLPSPVLLAIAVCVFAFLIPARGRTLWRSTYDPPPPRRRSHVLPLSQAPPHAA